MKNTLKKLTAIISSIAICAVSAVSLSSSAIGGTYYASGTLATVIESFGDDIIVEYSENTYCRNAFVISSNGEAHYFREDYIETLVTPKEGAELPIAEMNEYISDFYLEEDEEQGYIIHIPEIEEREAVYDIIKSYDEVQSIDELYTVRENTAWWFEGILFDCDLSDDELIEMFPELSLVKSEPTSDNYTNYLMFDLSVEIEGEVYTDLPIIEGYITDEIYNGLKRVKESELGADFLVTTGESVMEEYESGSVNVYNADAPAETTTTTATTTPSEITTTTTITEAVTETTAAETETVTDTTTAEAATTTKAAATTAKATTKTSTSSPKTGDSGLTGVFLAGTGAIALAVVLRKREKTE